jgi:predicted PurR-regulated permease PerM
MHEPADSTPQTAEPERPSADGRWPSSFAWLLATVAVALALAWLASRIEPYFAPLFLFPVLFGIALGLAMVGLARVLGPLRRAIAALGIVVGVAAIVVGQHYLAFRRARDEVEQQLARFEKTPLNAAALAQIGLPQPPESLLAFLQHTAEEGRPLAGHIVRGGLVWAWWLLDGLLTLIAAAVSTWFTLRRSTLPSQRTQVSP